MCVRCGKEVGYSLTEKEVKEVNAGCSASPGRGGDCGIGPRGKYNAYTAQERARIGKYAAEHGPVKTVRHCSKLLGRPVPDYSTTVALSVVRTHARLRL